MSLKQLTPLTPVAGLEALQTARKGAARMMAVRLPSEGLMLYSPIPAPGEDAVTAARALGDVTAILAPSPFHHLGIAEWHAALPQSTVIAPKDAVPRLSKRSGQTPSTKMPVMPDTVSILHPPGLKAPEVWLRGDGSNGVIWAVCDAFAGPAGVDVEPADTPKARGAFATMCVGDRFAYKEWAMKQIDRDRPVLLLPAHGNAVAGADLWRKLADIVEAL